MRLTNAGSGVNRLLRGIWFYLIPFKFVCLVKLGLQQYYFLLIMLSGR